MTDLKKREHINILKLQSICIVHAFAIFKVKGHEGRNSKINAKCFFLYKGNVPNFSKEVFFHKQPSFYRKETTA